MLAKSAPCVTNSMISGSPKAESGLPLQRLLLLHQ